MESENDCKKLIIIAINLGQWLNRNIIFEKKRSFHQINNILRLLISLRNGKFNLVFAHFSGLVHIERLFVN